MKRSIVLVAVLGLLVAGAAIALAGAALLFKGWLVAAIPFMLLTGWLDRYDRVWRAWQRGGDELLIKPGLIYRPK